MRNILVIGGGSIGERHVRCFLNTGRATVSLCELNSELRQDVTQRYQLPQSFESLDDALQHPFDGAVVCTPAHLHIPMALNIVRCGMGLLIEKPLSTSPQQIDLLQQEVTERQLPVSVAYVLRQHPAMQAVQQSISERRFGRPVQVVAVGGQHFPYYRPAYRSIYYNDHATGGGAIQDALTHIVNAGEWIVGPICRLTTDAEHCVLDGVHVEDTVHMLTRHISPTESDPQVLGSFCLNQFQAPNENSLTIHCEGGSVRCELHHNRWLTCREPGTDWTVQQQFSIERDELFTRQASAFLNQLDGTSPPACSLEQALQTLRVNLAALKSAQQANWVTL